MTGIILLNWNGIIDTAACIESIFTSNDRDLQIYVVDNNSANNEAATLAASFPLVKVLAQNENLGFCEGNNVGIRKALADGMEYVLILNNDTLVPENQINKLTCDLKKLTNAGAISPVILEYPAIEKVWFSKAQWDSSRAQFNLNPGSKNFEELKKNMPWESEFACGCCLLTSAKILNEVGLLDPRYFAYYDEAEWCKRLERKGYKSYVTGGSFIYHKVSRTTPGLVSAYLLARNRLLWMKENLSLSQRMKSFRYLNKEYIWHLLNIRGLVKGQYSKAYSRAFVQGWKDYKLNRLGKWSSSAEKKIFQS